jgi:hypothetical protein
MLLYVFCFFPRFKKGHVVDDVVPPNRRPTDNTGTRGLVRSASARFLRLMIIRKVSVWLFMEMRRLLTADGRMQRRPDVATHLICFWGKPHPRYPSSTTYHFFSKKGHVVDDVLPPNQRFVRSARCPRQFKKIQKVPLTEGCNNDRMLPRS